jgi:hypothetical protein
MARASAAGRAEARACGARALKHRRRTGLAIGLSVAFHGLALAVVVGTSLIGAWPTAPIEVEINGMRMVDLRDLPLGRAPAGDKRTQPTGAPPPAQAAIVAPEKGAGQKPKLKPKPPAPEVDEPPLDGAAPPRPQSVRAYGPAGSQVTALLRIDRLRGTPYAPLVDAVLMRLPDRRDLLDGTGIDLYRDVDAMLVATPDPVDPAVTFLAVRHRLTDAALREALDRGARATGRKLTWRVERGRPFAERRTDAADPRSRDERLILLAAPRLVVVTPPAYRSLILQGPAQAPALRALKGGGGAGGDATSGVGGHPGAGATPSADEHASWATLIRRIDAQDGIMPENAAALLSAEDVFSPRRPRSGSAAVAGTRGTSDEGPGVAPEPAPRIYGLPVPHLLTATIGIAPQPFADIDGDFSDASDAAAWEQQWPELRHKLLANPLVVLTGFSGLLGRVTLARTKTTVHIHIDATEMEMVRILQLVATQAFPLGG